MRFRIRRPVAAAQHDPIDSMGVADRGISWTSLEVFLRTTATELFIKVLAAIAFWIIGRWLVGRVVTLIGGIVCTVREPGLFGTTIVTPDNMMTIVGNG